jgi:chemotaxis protein MotA
MIVIVGCLVVLGAVIGGFLWSGGSVGALIHPSELLTIGGCAMGALILMSPKKVLMDLLKGVMESLKGTPYTKQGYRDLFKLCYEILRLARNEGLLALEAHVSSPHESAIFEKYPRIARNHHVLEFLCGALAPVIERTVTPEKLPGLLETEIKVLEQEHHAPLSVLTKTADGLPGFGIVAAVLGIVITMAHIDGPASEIGHKVGAALVGTFLGILLSYGFFAPLAVRIEFLSEAEIAYFRTIATIVQGLVDSLSPKVALEQARRGVTSEVRLSRDELEELFKEVEAG